MKKNISILDLAASWAQEDCRRAPMHSEAELAAAYDMIYGDTGDPKTRARRLHEFATTSGSAAVLTADVAARELQAMYTHTAMVMHKVLRLRRHIPNYNMVEVIRFDGGESCLPAVEEGGEYGNTVLMQAQSDTYRVRKFGEIFDITEEALYSDPIGVFQTLPQRFVRAVLRTVEAFSTSLFFDDGGPIDSFFTTQTGGAPATIPLTIGNLKLAVSQMLSYADGDGEPIVAMPKYLMVGPGLMIEAMTILNSISLNHVVDGTGSGDGIPTPQGAKNVLADLGIELLVNPWIASQVTSGTIASTCWALFTDPNNIPAGEFGTLIGYDYPKVEVPDEKDIKARQRDVLSYKVKHVFGGTRIDKRAVWGSFGQ